MVILVIPWKSAQRLRHPSVQPGMGLRWWTAAVLTISVVLGLLAVVGGEPRRVEAHAFAEASFPRQNERLTEAPQVLWIRFTEPLETEVSTLRLLDAAGHEVPGTQQSAQGDRELRLQVPELSPGAYTLEWKVLSQDGHVTEGTIRFTVAGAPGPGQPTAEEPPGQGVQPAAPPRVGAGEPSHDRGVASGTALGLTAVAVIVAGVLTGRLRRRG